MKNEKGAYMKYIYTALIGSNENGTKYYARIPDLPGCITTGKTLQDAVEQITDAASIWLVDAEDHDEPEIKATPQTEIKSEDNEIKTLIQVDTLTYRSRIDTKSVRKNVSLPAWLANMADKRGINCSQVLQEGLMSKLG